MVRDRLGAEVVFDDPAECDDEQPTSRTDPPTAMTAARAREAGKWCSNLRLPLISARNELIEER
jgi:hypothetical protein